MFANYLKQKFERSELKLTTRKFNTKKIWNENNLIWILNLFQTSKRIIEISYQLNIV